MNQYETTVIITPVLSEDDLQQTLNTYRDFLKEKGAEIIHEEKWGMKQLAYPIRSKNSGIYHIFEYKATPELIGMLELNFRRDENILRFLTVKLDKYSIEYNEKKRLGLVGPNKKTPPETEEKKESEEAPAAEKG